jgi:hypothetical protein
MLLVEHDRVARSPGKHEHRPQFTIATVLYVL